MVLLVLELAQRCRLVAAAAVWARRSGSDRFAAGLGDAFGHGAGLDAGRIAASAKSPCDYFGGHAAEADVVLEPVPAAGPGLVVVRAETRQHAWQRRDMACIDRHGGLHHAGDPDVLFHWCREV